MSNKPKITKEYLLKKIEAGHGQGHGSQYLPWIEIKRWNPSSVSTQCMGGLPPFYRTRGTFLSMNEWGVGLALSWVGVEVREQFPAWPWPHPHPLYGLDSDQDCELPKSAGMISVCDEMGIRHGNFPGTRIPYVWTFDFINTIRGVSDNKSAVVSIKPVENDRYINPDPLDRALEKLEAERRYCARLNIPYSVTGVSKFHPKLIANLDYLRGAAVIPKSDFRFKVLQQFLENRLDEAKEYPMKIWADWMIKDNKLGKDDAFIIVNHILWKQYIDVDLTKKIRYTRLTKPGGLALRSKYLKQLLKGDL